MTSLKQLQTINYRLQTTSYIFQTTDSKPQTTDSRLQTIIQITDCRLQTIATALFFCWSTSSTTDPCKVSLPSAHVTPEVTIVRLVFPRYSI